MRPTFKPALSGRVQVIEPPLRLSTVNMEEDAALERRFQSVMVNEPSEEALAI